MKKILRYIYAFLAVPLAVALRYMLMPLVGPGVPYITLFPATVVVALLAGFGPAIVAGILGSIVIDYLFIPPFYALELNVEGFSRMAVVTLTSAFVGYVGAVLRTARAKAERQAAALRESEERFKSIASNTPDHILVQDRELRYSLVVNPQLGLTVQDMIGKTDYDILTKDDAEKVTKIKRQVIETDNPVLLETSLIDLEGRQQFFDGAYVPQHDGRGNVYGIIGYFRNITARKRAEEAVLVSELRYRRLFEAARDGILILDAESGMIVDINPFTKDLLGHSHEEFLNKTIWEIDLFKNIVASKEAFLELQTKEYNRYENLPLVTKDGRHIVTEFVSNVYLVNDKKVIQCNLRDISKRVQAEEGLRQAKEDLEKINRQLQSEIVREEQIADELSRSNKDLEQFAYVASHDLQEPLRAISGFVSLLKIEFKSTIDAKKTEYMNFIVDGVARMQTLINGLLEYSRIDTRGKPAEMTDSNIALERALLNLQTSIKETDAKITAEDLPAVYIDSIQLIQLFQNLIGNAIKFRSASHPDIHVIAVRQHNVWQFAISDNGIGIDKQYVQRIFLIFQRLHTREQYPGTGIGLSLCKKIVERNNGKIWVESQPGNGSTFYFTIPDKGEQL